MNKRGFTLVEVIVVISLLGLVVIISSTNILGGSTRAKEKMLETKIKNIEKAAVLYGQDNRNKIQLYIDGKDSSGTPLSGEELEIYKNKYKFCYKEGATLPISNCYYYSNDGNNPLTITVDFLANPGVDENNKPIEPYINYDEGDIIKNPLDEGKNMNNCQIQIYQKYGKIYAVYDTTYVDTIPTNNTKCWK